MLIMFMSCDVICCEFISSWLCIYTVIYTAMDTINIIYLWMLSCIFVTKI